MTALSPYLWTFWRVTGLWFAALLFLLPLRRRGKFRLRLAAGLAGGVLLHLPVGLLSPTSGLLWLVFLVSFVLVVGFFALCADISRSAAVYCAVWVMVLYHLSCSLAIALLRALDRWPLASGICAVGSVAVLYLAV